MRNRALAVIGGVTFATFMIEAIMHYNMGYRRAHGIKDKIKMPPKKDLLELAAVVGVASLFNAKVVQGVNRWAEEHYG